MVVVAVAGAAVVSVVMMVVVVVWTQEMMRDVKVCGLEVNVADFLQYVYIS
jgi:hypothetical protein